MSKKRRVFGLVLIVVGVLGAIRSGRGILRLLRAGGPLVEARQELVDAEQENQVLRKRLAEVESPQFVEKEARNKLGYGKGNEVILVMSEDEAGPSAQQIVLEPEVPNWKKWWQLYIRL